MKVSLFIPCLNDQFFPQTGMNMVRVLQRLGVEVVYDPAQSCCGQPAFNSGYHAEARVLAERFIDIFSDAERIVAPSGSCASMVKIFYGDLLDLRDAYRERAERIRSRLHEFTSFLVDILGVEDVGAVFPARVTLHDACHGLRELGIRAQPRRLLAKVRGLEFTELARAEVCCGFGGTFAVKNAPISSAMGEEKAREIRRMGVDYVTAIDSSCLMQIDGFLKRLGGGVRTIHIADILAAQ